MPGVAGEHGADLNLLDTGRLYLDHMGLVQFGVHPDDIFIGIRIPDLFLGHPSENSFPRVWMISPPRKGLQPQCR